MKLVAIVGTNASFSYNRKLLWYMKREFKGLAQIDIVEVADLPMFSEDAPVIPDQIAQISEQIAEADGLIFSTPEYDHSITAALKSLIEWLSWGESHVLTGKPTMLVGASLGNLGTVFAQENLRQILNSPGIDAVVLAGNQFLLGRAGQAFSDRGDLLDSKTITWLTHCFENFMKFVRLVQPVSTDEAETEDFQAIDKANENWWLEDSNMGQLMDDDADTGSTEDLDDGTSMFA